MGNALLFFAVVLVVFLGVNVFLYVQTRPIFTIPQIGVWLKWLFIFLASCFFLEKLMNRVVPSGISHVLEQLGSIWLAAMLYLSLIFVVMLLLRLANHWFNISDYFDFKQHLNYHRIAVGAAYFLLAIILVIGHINATSIKAVNLNLEVDKSLSSNLRIVAVSDIHLGGIIGNRQLSKLIKAINEQNPDVLLIIGDTFDGDVTPVVDKNMCAQFADVKSKYGIFAVTGNHDYFGQFDKKIACLRNAGVTVLCDSTARISDYYIVGRNDRQSEQALHKNRSSMASLVEPLDSSKGIILLDHQPYNLGEAQQCGVDLQLSGHTHNGQMWPLNHIISSMYELGHGYMQKGKTHYCVSSGYGTWGPRIRLASRAELLVINLIPKK